MLQACNFIEKETLAQVFSCEFYEISKNTFFTKHFWATASTLPKINRSKIFYVVNIFLYHCTKNEIFH